MAFPPLYILISTYLLAAICKQLSLGTKVILGSWSNSTAGRKFALNVSNLSFISGIPCHSWLLLGVLSLQPGKSGILQVKGLSEKNEEIGGMAFFRIKAGCHIIHSEGNCRSIKLENNMWYLRKLDFILIMKATLVEKIYLGYSVAYNAQCIADIIQ